MVVVVITAVVMVEVVIRSNLIYCVWSCGVVIVVYSVSSLSLSPLPPP